MREARGILAELRRSGEEGLPVHTLYEQLCNEELLLIAYARTARNSGAMTRGVDGTSPDGMSLRQIHMVAERLRQGQFTWTPARRVYVDKGGSQEKRPIGITGWQDKLVQAAILLLLGALYEPRFSDRSHGFRPGRGCATAINQLLDSWPAVNWFVEGDIAHCFDSLDRRVLLDILGETVLDRRFLELVEGMLDAGYLEEHSWSPSPTGVSQGSVASPLLANIYLDRLDRFVESTLMTHFTGWSPLAALLRPVGRVPREQGEPHLTYVRYADDFLIGVCGERREANQIVTCLRDFLHKQLKLELSREKTLVTAARGGAARFLGYDIRANEAPEPADGLVVELPAEVVAGHCARYLHDGVAVARADLAGMDPADIVTRYDTEFRSVTGYYRVARNLEDATRLRRVMEVSLVKTLAQRLQLDVPEIYRRFQKQVRTAEGPRAVLRVPSSRGNRRLAEWGVVSLRPAARFEVRAITDEFESGAELVDRLLSRRCELCGCRDQVEVHQIRSLRPLLRPGRKPRWARAMAARRCKTLVVCRACHRQIHRRPPRSTTSRARPPRTRTAALVSGWSRLFPSGSVVAHLCGRRR